MIQTYSFDEIFGCKLLRKFGGSMTIAQAKEHEKQFTNVILCCGKPTTTELKHFKHFIELLHYCNICGKKTMDCGITRHWIKKSDLV